MAGKHRTPTNPREKRHHKPGWKPIFLAELEKWGVVEHAAHVAGVHVRTAYEAREKDPRFRADWAEAKGTFVGRLEALSMQRAMVGTPKPVYYQGKKIDTIQELENAHLRWVLAHLKPEVYGEKLDVTQTVNGSLDLNVTGTLDVTLLSDEELATLDAILERAAGGALTPPAVGPNGAGKAKPA